MRPLNISVSTGSKVDMGIRWERVEQLVERTSPWLDSLTRIAFGGVLLSLLGLALVAYRPWDPADEADGLYQPTETHADKLATEEDIRKWAAKENAQKSAELLDETVLNLAFAIGSPSLIWLGVHAALAFLWKSVGAVVQWVKDWRDLRWTDDPAGNPEILELADSLSEKARVAKRWIPSYLADCCAVLGLSQDESRLSVADVERAFRRAAFAHHPDKNPEDPHAAERFFAAREAHDKLVAFLDAKEPPLA